jgi:hypothetical protein
LREVLDTGDFDIVIATHEINEGITKRWVVAWKFIELISEYDDGSEEDPRKEGIGQEND